MNPISVALAPARLALRALDDVHTLASSVRQGPEERESLVYRLDRLHEEMLRLNRLAESFNRQATDLIEMAGSLDAVGRKLHEEAEEISENMDPVLESLDRIDDMSESMDTLADSVEPLQGAAERVGRIADRFSPRRGRSDGDG